MKLTEEILKNAVTENEEQYFTEEEIQQILSNQEKAERLNELEHTPTVRILDRNIELLSKIQELQNKNKQLKEKIKEFHNQHELVFVGLNLPNKDTQEIIKQTYDEVFKTLKEILEDKDE